MSDIDLMSSSDLSDRELVPIIPVLTGATASGKTALALTLAQRWPLELVSADAMMVYTGLNIGTAKPTPAERARVPHHLIDVVQPDERFSVARYVTLAEAAIGAVLAKRHLPLVVGGTGFYIRALTTGLPTTPEADLAWQQPLWDRVALEGVDGLAADLAQLSPADAEAAQRNPRRVVRALEIWQRTGRSPATFPLQQPRYRYDKRGLEANDLERAITERTERMFAEGLVAEVAGLLQRYPEATTALQAIGYKEVRGLLEGRVALAETQQAVTQATLRYAKRQRTWFAKEPGLQPLRAEDADDWVRTIGYSGYAKRS